MVVVVGRRRRSVERERILSFGDSSFSFELSFDLGFDLFLGMSFTKRSERKESRSAESSGEARERTTSGRVGWEEGRREFELARRRSAPELPVEGNCWYSRLPLDLLLPLLLLLLLALLDLDPVRS